MLKPKDELIKRIETIIKDNFGKKEFVQSKSEQLFVQFEIPFSISNDILTLRNSLENYENFILFCVLKVITDRENDIETYFTNAEINSYSNKKYVKGKIKFPIKFRVIQVSDDQWIGSIDASKLIELRDARLINYNEATQRPLTRKTINGIEYYHITINESAVSAIIESFLNGTYISNPITLNIPETSDFDYDGEYIIIKSMDMFDIIDGYHRYVALQRIMMNNKDFDYTMELRLVCFPEDKARQFIWQEDQKTKMSKIDSDSMNQNNIANQIVSRLNQKPPFNGMINNNAGKIDAAFLGRLVNLYLVDSKKKQTRSMMITLSDLIYNRLLLLVDDDETILDKKWDVQLMVAAIHMIYRNVDESEYVAEVKKLRDILHKEENEIYIRSFARKEFRKVEINRIDKLV